VRCGIEDNLWGRKGERITTVQQIEQLVRISRELYREIASGQEARRICRIGEFHRSPGEALSRIGWAPNRAAGQQGFTQFAA
jgi:hypothetical protein